MWRKEINLNNCLDGGVLIGNTNIFFALQNFRNCTELFPYAKLFKSHNNNVT